MYRSRTRGWETLDAFFEPSWLRQPQHDVRNDVQSEKDVGDGQEEREAEESHAEEVDYHDMLQRLQADFVNYKRRVEREREEQTRQANRELMLRILPAIDDLRRALDSVPEDVAESEWARGIAHVGRKLMTALEEEGLERIEAEGEAFDPWQHEAVFCEEGPEQEEGTVRSVCRDGYRLHDKVVRPAQVVVCKGECRNLSQNEQDEETHLTRR
jgi:molecular chaperone GrpE